MRWQTTLSFKKGLDLGFTDENSETNGMRDLEVVLDFQSACKSTNLQIYGATISKILW